MASLAMARRFPTQHRWRLWDIDSCIRAGFMATRRASDFDLRAAIRSVSFTPAQRDLGQLFMFLDEPDEQLAQAAEAALLRLDAAAAGAEARSEIAATRMKTPLGRARLTRLLGRLARQDPSLLGALLDILTDDDAKTRRSAIISLGKLGPVAGQDPAIEAALLDAWQREERPELRRTLIEALGKVGGAPTRELLRTLDPAHPGLGPASAQAGLMVKRRLSQSEPWTIDAARSPRHPLALVFHSRAGLESLVVDELEHAPGVARIHRARPGRVEAMLEGNLESVLRSRVMFACGFLVSQTVGSSGGARMIDSEDMAAAVAQALTSPLALEVFRTFTRGPIRYRIAWAGGEKRRAERYRLIEAIARREPALINDPSVRGWDVIVSQRGSTVGLELRPRLRDTRFAYRVATLPASSHPTVAAALARLGGARPDDVVWDPFMGAAGELIERARLGPYAALHGSDIAPAAILAARQNLAAAGIRDAQLYEGEALAATRSGLTLVVSNPPLGRRLLSHDDVLPLYQRLLDHLAGVLRPGGRIAWTTPRPQETSAHAAALGFQVTWRATVDMGGFHVEMQLLRRSIRRSPGRAGPAPRGAG